MRNADPWRVTRHLVNSARRYVEVIGNFVNVPQWLVFEACFCQCPPPPWRRPLPRINFQVCLPAALPIFLIGPGNSVIVHCRTPIIRTRPISEGAICDQSMDVTALAITANTIIATVVAMKPIRIQCEIADSQVCGGAGVDKSSLPQSAQKSAFRAFGWPRGHNLTLYVRPQ